MQYDDAQLYLNSIRRVVPFNPPSLCTFLARCVARGERLRPLGGLFVYHAPLHRANAFGLIGICVYIYIYTCIMLLLSLTIDVAFVVVLAIITIAIIIEAELTRIILSRSYRCNWLKCSIREASAFAACFDGIDDEHAGARFRLSQLRSQPLSKIEINPHFPPTPLNPPQLQGLKRLHRPQSR
jgi:hypothetical protein